MARLRSNFHDGTLSPGIGDVATTASSAAFAALPAVASPDYLMLVLDPEAVAGNPEIVKVTAHTAATTSVTIVRAQESTVARAHLTGTAWLHGPTVADWLGPGTVDDFDAMVIVAPDSDSTSGIIVKSPSAEWGDETPPEGYAEGNALVVLKHGTAVENDDLVLFRINGVGGMGMAGGIHVATGLRLAELGPQARAIWVQPAVDISYAILDITAAAIVGDALSGHYLAISDTDSEERLTFTTDHYLSLTDPADDPVADNSLFLASANAQPSDNIRLALRPGLANVVGLYVEGATGQSGELMKFAGPDHVGHLNVAGDFAVNWLDDGGTVGVARIAAKDSPADNVRAYLHAVEPDVTALVLKAAADQTAVLLSVQNSAGTLQTAIGDGYFATFQANGINGAVVLYGGDTPASGTRAQIRPVTAGTVGLRIDGATAQTADQMQVRDVSSNIQSRFNKAGYFMTRKTAAPADVDLANSEVAIWWDATIGATGVKYKGKDSAGTVVSGTL